MSVNPLSAVSGASGASGAKATKKADDNSPEAIQERFMALLVAQLKNQDPLEPMDNSQVTSQMAQLNTVTGIQDLNKSMEGMVAAVSSSQTVQVTGMLGRTVMLEGNGLSLKEGAAKGGFELKQAADNVKVNVMNKAGDVIDTIDVGGLSKGVHEFDWSGKNSEGEQMADGQFKFEVVATAAGQPAELTQLARVEVQGIRNAGAAGSLLLTSDGSEVAVADVKQIF